MSFGERILQIGLYLAKLEAKVEWDMLLWAYCVSIEVRPHKSI